MTGYINLAYYQKKDWKRFLEIIEDRESMFDNWEDWSRAYSNTKRELTSQGFVIKDFVVNLDELINYCKTQGVKNDGKARSHFVSKKSKMNEEHILKVKEILTQWNPLRDQSSNTSDLNDYETEAVDIIFHINTEIYFKNTNNPKKRVQTIIKEVLNEAFNLLLTDKDCEKPTEFINQVLS